MSEKEEERLKSSLVRARHAIVDKLHKLHGERVKQGRKYEEKYSPITSSLNQLIATNEAILSKNERQNRTGDDQVNVYDRIAPDEFESFNNVNVNREHAIQKIDYTDVSLPNDPDNYDGEITTKEVVSSGQNMQDIIPIRGNSRLETAIHDEPSTSSISSRRVLSQRSLKQNRDSISPYTTNKNARSTKLKRSHVNRNNQDHLIVKDSVDGYTDIDGEVNESSINHLPARSSQNYVNRNLTRKKKPHHRKKINARNVQRHNEEEEEEEETFVFSPEDYDEMGGYRGNASKRRKILVTADQLNKKKGRKFMKSKREGIVISPDDYDEKGGFRGLAAKRRKIEAQSNYLKNRIRKFRESIILRRSKRVMDKVNATTQGKGLEKEFIPYNANIVYEYYDDPNELCDRLRLLIASKQAGNSNHDQEINSIVEELRENNIIE